MFNQKRKIRELTNQLLCFDTIESTFNVVKTMGLLVYQRKDHSAAVVGNSMIVYGGTLQNGNVTNEILRYDFISNEWEKM